MLAALANLLDSLVTPPCLSSYKAAKKKYLILNGFRSEISVILVILAILRGLLQMRTFLAMCEAWRQRLPKRRLAPWQIFGRPLVPWWANKGG